MREIAKSLVPAMQPFKTDALTLSLTSETRMERGIATGSFRFKWAQQGNGGLLVISHYGKIQFENAADLKKGETLFKELCAK